MSRAHEPAPRRGGMTLIELMLAMALASIVMLGVFRLVDLALDLWTRGEARRAVVERSTTVAELLAADLRGLHNGQAGDLLVEWQPHDADGDKRVDRIWPRLRLVRQASEAELRRLFLAELDPETQRTLLEEGHLPAEEEGGARLELPAPTDLVEVCWTVVPAGRGDAAQEGLLLRGVRRVDGSAATYFRDGFFSSAGQPPVGALTEVTAGVLHCSFLFATQTTLLQDGWQVGDGMGDAATSWDAWSLDRPDVQLSDLNQPGRGMPAIGDDPLLPRRVRVELEFETERDRRRRPRLEEPINHTAGRLPVSRGDLVPTRPGLHVLVDAEWMEVLGVEGDEVRVKRGARATLAVPHDADALVHFGETVVTEVPIPLYRDDWNLK